MAGTQGISERQSEQTALESVGIHVIHDHYADATVS